MSKHIQKIVFVVIVGAALIVAGLMFSFGPMVMYRFGPPDLTATAAAVSVRATEVSLKATEMALHGDVSGASPLSENLTWNGLQILVVSVNNDAWELVKAQNQNNDPPLDGKHMLMVTVQVTNVEAQSDGPMRIDDSDFSLMGERRIIYTTYGSETRCGVIPDRLDGVVARGGNSITGNICMQVPVDEKEFMLIYEQFSGDYPAVYFELPE